MSTFRAVQFEAGKGRAINLVWIYASYLALCKSLLPCLFVVNCFGGKTIVKSDKNEVGCFKGKVSGKIFYISLPSALDDDDVKRSISQLER